MPPELFRCIFLCVSWLSRLRNTHLQNTLMVHVLGWQEPVCPCLDVSLQRVVKFLLFPTLGRASCHGKLLHPLPPTTTVRVVVDWHLRCFKILIKHVEFTTLSRKAKKCVIFQLTLQSQNSTNIISRHITVFVDWQNTNLSSHINYILSGQRPWLGGV